MSPILVVCVLFDIFGTLWAHPQMYTVPCPLTHTPYSPSTDRHSQNYNPYPMKIIVNYPHNNAGQTPSCSDSPNSDSPNRRGDFGAVSTMLKLPGVLADKLMSGEISLN